MAELFPQEQQSPDKGYRVLARKYRPTSFDGLIGQEALVRTLSNAITSGRLAHAFLLTGIRGVGKTTTARIIARALNCIGADGKGGPTISPCGVCEHCRGIAEDRHMDVVEMDAASRTGVGDIREIIETVHYMPASARYKIYIIDEVHMLSTSAFNALLKTLEEPPPHVKFIFATTELRKIPVTILSRCQRFDLRRVNAKELADHLKTICEKEQASVDPDALALIAGIAEGSVRDALSLLDQAIAHSEGSVSARQLQDMLGLADRARVYDLLEAVLSGEIKEALGKLAMLYEAGADPALLLQDLLEAVHFLTRLKVSPELKDDPSLPEIERRRGAALAEKLAMPELARCWQMMLKGLEEARIAPSSLMAAEMLLVRLAYASGLPTPAEIIKSLPQGAEKKEAPLKIVPQESPATRARETRGYAGSATAVASEPVAVSEPELQAPLLALPDFESLVKLAEEKKEMILAARLRNDVRVVQFSEGVLEIQPAHPLPADFVQNLNRRLNEWSGRRWVVAVSQKEGAPSMREREQASQAAAKADALVSPLVAEVMELFPGAEIKEIREANDE